MVNPNHWYLVAAIRFRPTNNIISDSGPISIRITFNQLRPIINPLSIRMMHSDNQYFLSFLLQLWPSHEVYIYWSLIFAVICGLDYPSPNQPKFGFRLWLIMIIFAEGGYPLNISLLVLTSSRSINLAEYTRTDPCTHTRVSCMQAYVLLQTCVSTDFSRLRA